jgi:hypothetical protein
MENMSNYVTIAQFMEAYEAHLARIKLDCESIQCRILDENLNVLRIISRQFTPIRLQVAADDEEAAKKILSGEQPLPIDDEELERQALEALRVDES